MSRADPGAIPITSTAIRICARLAGAEGLVVGLDFDGTLSPIAEDRGAPTVTPANRRALSALSAHDEVTVAVISGRRLADLRPRVGVDGVVYAGNHGLELAREGAPIVHPDARKARPAVSRAVGALESRIGEVTGCEIEDKGVTATVHYRRTPAGMVDDVRAAVRDVATDAGLRLVPGKQVLELRPDVECNKGSTMRMLAYWAPTGWRSIYVGDDTTDEDAFRAIAPSGVGVHVGDDEDTAAGFRIPSHRATATLLAWLRTEVLGVPDQVETTPGPRRPRQPTTSR